jgi:hypothetical protein
MPIQKPPRRSGQDLTEEPASPFLSEEIFNAELDILDKQAAEATWYQRETPFLYAFQSAAQNEPVELENEEFDGLDAEMGKKPGGAVGEFFADKSLEWFLRKLPNART